MPLPVVSRRFHRFPRPTSWFQAASRCRRLHLRRRNLSNHRCATRFPSARAVVHSLRPKALLIQGYEPSRMPTFGSRDQPTADRAQRRTDRCESPGGRGVYLRNTSSGDTRYEVPGSCSRHYVHAWWLRQSLGCAKCRDTAVWSLSKFYSATAWRISCHRLTQWSVTLAATQGILSLSSYTHARPPPKAAAGHGEGKAAFGADVCSCQRETGAPAQWVAGKPVASLRNKNGFNSIWQFEPIHPDFAHARQSLGR